MGGERTSRLMPGNGHSERRLGVGSRRQLLGGKRTCVRTPVRSRQTGCGLTFTPSRKLASACVRRGAPLFFPLVRIGDPAPSAGGIVSRAALRCTLHRMSRSDSWETYVKARCTGLRFDKSALSNRHPSAWDDRHLIDRKASLTK